MPLIKKFQHSGKVPTQDAPYTIINGHKVRTDQGFKPGSSGDKLQKRLIDNLMSKEDQKKYFNPTIGQLNEAGWEKAQEGYFDTDLVGNQSLSDLVGHALYFGGLFPGIGLYATLLGAANDAAGAKYHLAHGNTSNAAWDIAGATAGSAIDLFGDYTPPRYRPYVEALGKIIEWGEPVVDLNDKMIRDIRKNLIERKMDEDFEKVHEQSKNKQ